MATVDVLVTRYELDDSKFQSGAKGVSGALQRLSSLFQRHNTQTDAAGNATEGFASSLGGLSGIAGPASAALATVATGIIAVVGAQATFAKSSIEAASRFGQYEAVFTGVTGSLQKGQEIMRGLQDYAQGSALSFDAIAKSSMRLAVSGLSIKQLLPVMERLAVSTGDLSPEKIDMFASAMIKIKGGALGEAKEILTSAGIGMDKLSSAGVKISRSGEIQSSPAKFMEAVAKLASSPELLRVQGEMSKTLAVKISNLGDAFDKAQVAFGKALSGDTGNALTSFSDQLNDLTDSGVVGEVADSFKSLVTSLADADDIGSGLTKMAAGIKAFNTNLEASMKGAKEGPLGKALFGGVLGALMNIFDQTTKAEQEGVDASLELHRMRKKKAKQEGLTETGQPLSDKPKTPDGPTPVLRKIEENTRQSRDALQAMAFGNGRGMAGVTPVELSAISSRRRNGRSVSVDLYSMLEEMVMDVMSRTQAAGV